MKVKNTENSGRETTFLPVKKLPKGAKKWFSRAVLLFKGEETGCILIRSFHLKINFPKRKNIKCSKLKRIIKKNPRNVQKKIMGN